MPTPKKKSDLNSPIPTYERGDVWILDTAAGRLIGTAYGVEEGELWSLANPAVLTFTAPEKPEEMYAIEFAPILYAPEIYYISWGGVRGSVPATEKFFNAYVEYLNEREKNGGTA